MFDFYGKRRIYYGISIALILAGIIGLFVRGVKLDITFSGGAKLSYSYKGEQISTAEVESLVRNTLGRDATVQNASGYQTDDISLVISLAGNKSLTTEEQDQLYNALTEKLQPMKLSRDPPPMWRPHGRRFLTRGWIATALRRSLHCLCYLPVFRCIRYYRGADGFDRSLP